MVRVCNCLSFQVGDYKVYPKKYLLENTTTKTTHALRPQEMQVLMCLVKRPNEVVPRHDIAESVWKRTDCIEVDNAIARLVSNLRKSLGGRHRQYVRTYSKSGYCLVAPVVGHSSCSCLRAVGAS